MLKPSMTVVAIAAALALFTSAAYILVNKTARGWFEKDIELRARLAVNGARQALVLHWRKEAPYALRELLEEIAHDERIMAAAACGTEPPLFVPTKDFPVQFSCEDLRQRLHEISTIGESDPPPLAQVTSIPGGSVHISAIPVRDGTRELGFVVLVQDLSYIERREIKTRNFLLLLIGLLSAAAATLALVTQRLAWRGWNAQIRLLLRGAPHADEFQPLLKDVRELVERLSSESESSGRGGRWDAQRLKLVLHRYLHGERVLIVANREPYIHQMDSGGSVRVMRPASGLVTALEPVMRACSGVWIAHGSGSADRQTADPAGHVRVPPGEEAYVLRRIWLSPEEERGYYYGFSNEGLWPLCHLAHTRPTFRREDWKHYQDVNLKFANAVCSEVTTDDPIVLVQDYHFGLAPRMIRRQLPRATIITFWHIPWPNSERFGICPWRQELLEGMLGSSILGFHTQQHCNNFLDGVDTYLEARIDREQNAVVCQGQTSLVRPYPISVEWPSQGLSSSPPVVDCRQAVLAELELPPGTLLGVGVDRLDYTKGIEERLLAVECLLAQNPQFVGRFSFVQIAAPSRTLIERYRVLNDSVEALAARINSRFSSEGYRPVVLLREHHEPPAVLRLYRAADFCYVSSLHDGMNLVAKEFVAARDDERGVLILSHFTGAARELTEALIVNPYDIDEAASAMTVALKMSPEEQQDRMRAMRSLVSEFNVYRWAGHMLVDAARLRRRGRLSARLSENVSSLRTIQP